MAAEIEKAMVKNTVFGDVIKYYKQLANGKKAVCYCASVRHSQRTAEVFNGNGIKAAHIDGSTPKAERDSIISAFRRGDITVLCNVDLISEGFDVPDCECAILLRPTKSLTLYIQQAMRCMRYRPNKRAVIIDHVGNYARFGMPDDDREWSLEKKPKAQHKKQEQSDKVKQWSGNDFSSRKHGSGDCPSAERKLETDSSVGLVKVEGFKLDFSSPADCHTYPELLQYAKSHGYKSGWAYYQARQRGLIG